MLQDKAQLARLIRDISDYPKPGVTFKDITPLLASPIGFQNAIEEIVRAAPADIDAVLGIEARGFILAAPVALALGAGFVPARKPGKLPGEIHEIAFDLEYGTDALQVHADAIKPGAKVLIVDDVLATGGTMIAAAELLKRLRADLVQVSLLLELGFLGGRQRLYDNGIQDVQAVLSE
ncbi:MAG: adenine phosphoribosyltransferase [Arachnia propionica]|nr:MAG: adenine phosphoribosyltransferase [Arachnia propionica]